MISSVMRSVPLRIASVATAARSILSSPIVPSERVRSFAVRVVLPCRSDGYFSGMIFSNEASSCRNLSSVRHRGRIVGGNRFSTEETERMTRIISSAGPIPNGVRSEDFAVFAGVLPEGKYNLVKAFQKNGDTVGMCGDGANDAPA